MGHLYTLEISCLKLLRKNTIDHLVMDVSSLKETTKNIMVNERAYATNYMLIALLIQGETKNMLFLSFTKKMIKYVRRTLYTPSI